MLGRLTRIGVNNIEKYSLYRILKDQAGRVKINLLYERLTPYIGNVEDPNDIDEVFTVIGQAYRRLQENI